MIYRNTLITVLLIILSSLSLLSEESDSLNSFGVTLNTSFNNELFIYSIIPSIIYKNGKSEYQLGLGLAPFVRNDETAITTDLNYKYFPNGKSNKFNIYFTSSLSYIYNELNAFYPTTYNYIFLNGGYGFQVFVVKNLYVGTDINIGSFTYHKRSEIPIDAFKNKNLFDQFDYNISFQFSISYYF